MNLLTRVTLEAKAPTLSPIPWPENPPTCHGYEADPESAFPPADAVVLVYTAAEFQAMCDVLTPGCGKSDYVRYERGFHSVFAPYLTWRSPAREAQRAAEYMLTEIGGAAVLCVHSELHVATDSAALPIATLWQRLITEAGPKALIDSGTAGGIGSSCAVGDCVVAQNLRWDCTGFLKSESYARLSYPCTLDTSGIDFSLAESLMASNAHLLAPQTTRAPQVTLGDVLTCDRFLFDDAEDTYGLRTYDPLARAEEMDAAVLGVVAAQLGSAMPRFTSLRSVSDPQMPQMATMKAEKNAAGVIYDHYGYLAEALTLAGPVWQVINSL